MRRAMLEALEKRYEAEIAEADTTIKIYLDNSVGIGEHPQHLDEIDKQLAKIVEAEEKQNALQAFKLWSVFIVVMILGGIMTTIQRMLKSI